MINTLTSEQEAKIPVYVEKWLQVGLSTESLDKERASEAVRWVYRDILGKAEPLIIFADSPWQATMMGYILHELSKLSSETKLNLSAQLKSQLNSDLESTLWSQIGLRLDSRLKLQLGPQLWSRLWSELGSQFWTKIRPQLESQLGSQLKSQIVSQFILQLESQFYSKLSSKLWWKLRSEIGSKLVQEFVPQLWSQLGSQLWSQLESQSQKNEESSWVKRHYDDYYFCSWWTHWVGYYDYVLQELFPEQRGQFSKFEQLCEAWKNLHCIYPYEGICFVVDRPKAIHRDTQGRLHNEKGAALEYRDGYSLFSLNGRTVPEWVVTTQPETWTKEQVLGEKNTECRREIIRKLGIQKAVELFEAVSIDIKDYSGAEHFLTHEGRKYELLEVDFGTGGKRKYLKMKNASTSDWHVEAVHPDCRSVDQALGFRESAILGDVWKNSGYVYQPPIALT